MFGLGGDGVEFDCGHGTRFPNSVVRAGFKPTPTWSQSIPSCCLIILVHACDRAHLQERRRGPLDEHAHDVERHGAFGGVADDLLLFEAREVFVAQAEEALEDLAVVLTELRGGARAVRLEGRELRAELARDRPHADIGLVDHVERRRARGGGDRGAPASG